MNAPASPASPERARFWLRFISLGVHPGMSFAERKTCLVLNSVAVFFSVGSLYFVTVNVLHGNFHLVPYNACGLLSGTLGLFLLGRRRLLAALWVLCIGGLSLSFLQGYLLRNGSELGLLHVVILAIFLMDSVPWRLFLVVLGSAGYLVVQAGHYDFFQNAAVPRSRYLLVTAIGLATIAVYAAIFRAVSDDYRKLVEQKNAELETERAALRRANAAKERLFSLIAHDLMAPVGHLKEALAHLDAGRLRQEQFVPLQDRLRGDVDEVHGFLDNLLAWSIGQTEAIVPRPATLSLAAQAGEAVRLLEGVAREKGVAVASTIAAGAAARADADQVAAVFRNLVSNAIKFTPSGGSVVIEAAPLPSSWQVTVRDDGVGMDADKARRLFDDDGGESTRGTANEKGLGLGLKICREFVQANGGTIRAESGPGRGSAVHFTLPKAG